MVNGTISRSLCIIVFILVSVSAFGEQTAVYTETAPRIVKEGQWVTVTFYIRNNDTAISVNAPSIPDGVRKTAGPNIRPFYGAEDPIPFGSGVQVGYVFQLAEAGRFVLQPFRFTLSDGNVFQSSALVLRCGEEDDSGSLVVPFEVAVTVSHEDSIAGEPVTVRIQAREVEELTPFSVEPPLSIPDCIVEEIPEAETIEATRYSATTFYTVPVKTYLITPLSSGDILLPELTVTGGKASRPTPRRNISVQERPKEITESGAIGEFRFNVRIGTDAAGDNSGKGGITDSGKANRIVLYEELTGTGNVNLLSLPVPETRGFDVSDHEVNRQIRAEAGGYTGSVEHRYYFSLNQEEADPFIRVPSFYWFSREHNRVLRTREYRFDRRNLPDITYVKEGGSSLDESAPAAERETVSVSELLSDALKKSESLSEEAASSLRRAYAAYRSETYGSTVFELRKILMSHSAHKMIRAALVRVEEDLELRNQIPLPVPVNHLAVFIITIAFLAAAGIGILVYYVTKHTLVLGAVVLFLVLFIAGASFSGVLVYKQSREWGVAERNAEVKKIPRRTASAWFTLPEGTAFYITASTDSYYLIKTGNSMEGWVNQTDILVDRK